MTMMPASAPHPMDAMMFNRPDRNGTNPKPGAIRDARGSPMDGHMRGGHEGPGSGHEGGQRNQVHAL